MRYFLIYLLLINAASFGLMLVDKYKAKRNLWRIPERCLFALALLGGSIGSLTGMYLVRHKTKHRSFTIGMPMILIFQVICIIFCYVHFFS